MKSYADENSLNVVRRVLCGPSSFLVDDWKVGNGRIAAQGWCLTEYEGALEFKVNGRWPEDQRVGISSPSLEKVFPFYPRAGQSAFTLSSSLLESDIERGYVEISLCDKVFGEPLNSWHSTRLPVSSDAFQVPDSGQLQRTQGNTSAARYLAYGSTVAGRIELILSRYFRRPVESLEVVVDWGVGCGRIARYFASRVDKFIGLDIDTDNIEWCKSNLPGSYIRNNLMPPLQLESASVDLLYGISVFTHLTHEAAVAWRDEIARVLRPGGICIITVHGLTGIGRILDDSRLTALAQNGFDASEGDRRLDSVLEDRQYYRATFQSPATTLEFFGSKFMVIDQIQGANALLQDFVVLTKPS